MPENSTDQLTAAVRGSHERLTALLTPLSGEQVRSTSYAKEWSIAQVASHLGSQAEIFDHFITAGLEGTPPPPGETFQQIWARWDASTPEEQVQQSISANDAFVARIGAVSEAQRDAFTLEMFGSPLDFDGLLAMRLGEHALHTWDVAVALDPSATVADDAVAALIDGPASVTAGRMKPADADGLPDVVDVYTSRPDRRFRLTTRPEVSLVPGEAADSAVDPLRLTAEELIRLVYGRLDPVNGEDPRLAGLRQVFPGF